MKIGGMEIKNRIVMCAMGIHSPRMVNHDSSYTQDGIDYFVERAKGGVGLIVTGGLAVQNKYDSVEGGVCVTNAGDAFVGNMRKLTDEVHRYGAKIVCQLSAASGRTAPVWFMSGEPIAPSDGLPNVWKPEIKHRALTVDDIELYLHGFEVGAKLAKDSGFDGVEIHAMHEGYLLDQFSIESMNQRTDRYGGSMENRLRFAKEIVERIRKVCGDDFPAMMRYSVRSMMKGFNQGALPGEDFKEFGRDLEESKKVARLLQDYGYDALDADNGTYDSWYWPHPPVYMPEACNLKDCAELRKAVDIPVICAGKMDHPEIAEEAVASGKIDAIGLARPLLTDPEWPNKVRNGDAEDIRPCIGCHVGCLNRIFHGKDMSCALNPACCQERAYELKPAAEKKSVMVVGGGIAGMEAARVCAIRGYDVDLYEKSGRLGGMFVPAASMSFKEADRNLIRWYIRQMEKKHVNVHLNTEADAALIGAKKPDVVYVATGSTPRRLNVPGADSGKILGAIDALLNPERIGKKVAVIGGGLTGIEFAYDLSMQGKKVDVVEMLPEILAQKDDLCAANEMMLRACIDHYKVGIHTNARLTAITDAGIVYEADGEKKELDCDSIIVSIGYVSNRALYDSVKDCGAKVELLGDADHVSNLMGAIWRAYESARNI